MNYLSTYQTFANKYELNEAIALHLERHGDQLNKTEQIVLKRLSQYAVKYPGAAHLKLSTIAGLIQKSERTVRRSVEKLEHFKVIERKSFLRGKGGQGANIFVFRPYHRPVEAAHVVVEPKKIVASVVEQEPFEQHKEKPVTYYARFTNLVASYLGENNENLVRKLYGVYKAKSIQMMKFSIHADKGELFKTLAIQAVNILFQTTKKKAITNWIGYYDGILRELIDQNLFADAFMDYAEPVEFFIPH